MYKDFHSLDDLFAWIKTDKEWDGANAGLHNRYPIRFILFDNFVDFNDFIVNRPDGIYSQSIEKMLDQDFPDLFLSYSQLSKDICAYVKKIPANDFVIYPFSEMTRFYQNDTEKEFDSLVKTIRLQQPPADAQKNHVRLYIPIVGMQEKMSKFITDANTFVWEYKTSTQEELYRLILTNGNLYNVSGLEEKYSVVRNLREWLKLWEQGENVKKNLICSSKTIYISADNAQPDNAFEYIVCDNAYEFLTKGLLLNFGNVTLVDDDMHYWEELASHIDIVDFDFTIFVHEKFGSFSLHDSKGFVEAWFDCNSDFDKWLLTIYYRKEVNDTGYVCSALRNCKQLSSSELFSNIATNIFDEPYTQDDIDERQEVIAIAKEHNVRITDAAEKKLYSKLVSSAEDSTIGYRNTVRLLTSFTFTEQKLIVEWLGKGLILRSDIERIYPDLYNYMAPMSIKQSATNHWVNHYVDAYKESKLSNSILPNLEAALKAKNGTPAEFYLWRDNFKTVKTLLHNREDIEVFYWIDGLGIDWIPYIVSVIKSFEHDGAYLNEVMIASAELPTTTSVNRVKLESLVTSGELKKCGDLDDLAHQHTQFPDYIIDEMGVVKDAISQVLSQYNSKKIAFVSDHGLSYMAQYGKGLNLSGVVGDHEGRVAKCSSNCTVGDNKYVILDDQKTICALSYDSLTSKTNKGHGAHGGCTPEEVLVPIIIVSPHKNSSNFTANLEECEISSTNPVVRFTILGLSSIDTPHIIYNGLTYMMNNISGNIYESERLSLNDTATRVTLQINDFEQNEFIKLSLGVKEDDLFSDF